MMDFLAQYHVSLAGLVLLCTAVGAAVLFEAINGFHDTANAVVTVIYTHTLPPKVAVIFSGLCNFLGVYIGGVAVAFAIVHLLPVDILVNIGSGAGMAMIFALLLSAIIWNFGTWYKGLPASSSHTLIGAIIGVGMANALFSSRSVIHGINLHQTQNVLTSLLVSPLIGFALAALLLLFAKNTIQDPKLYEPPAGKTPPPWWIRSILVATCGGVSFAHGSNDGQKGVGLIMLILIGILPFLFALNLNYKPDQINHAVETMAKLEAVLRDKKAELVRMAKSQAPPGSTQLASSQPIESYNPSIGLTINIINTLHEEISGILGFLSDNERLDLIPPDDRWSIRQYVLRVDNFLGDILDSDVVNLSSNDRSIINTARKELRGLTDYAPYWVMLLVAFSLGIGTMIGWKRIVVTVGEKIGKTHLTYGQGASAEIVAAGTIGLADVLGFPVSTTHVLSSGVAGTMTANKSGLQYGTLKSIAMAWILTFPIAMLLSGTLFIIFRLLVR